MTISYRWLCEYLPAPIPKEELSTILTSIGLEVESLEMYENFKGGLQGLLVGEVLELIQHPNADKLKLTKEKDWKTEYLDAIISIKTVKNVSDGVEHILKYPWTSSSSKNLNLLNDLDKIDWSYSIKETQKNWIGKSTGCSLFFDIVGFDDKIEVFTTRPDTIFGVSFMTLAPEHELVNKIVTIDKSIQVTNYINDVSTKSERDRISNVKSI